MARFAPVVPIEVAASLQRHLSGDLLGGYHLVLAHDILAKPEAYKEVYSKARQDHPDAFIILDNSVIELGKPMGLADLISAADIVKPDCIVIPDVMGDGEATQEEAFRFVQQYANYLQEAGRDGAPDLMGVVQGDTVDRALDTAAVFYALPLVEYVGVPRILAKQHGSRMPFLCEYAPQAGLFRGTHLLGFSDDLLDDVSCARLPFIQGIDSTVPVRAGTYGIELNLEDPKWSEQLGPRAMWWDLPLHDSGVLKNMQVVWRNLERYRSWIKDTSVPSQLI